MPDLARGTTFVDGVSIANASNLNNLVDNAIILPAFISGKTAITTPGSGVEHIVDDGGTLKKITHADLATSILSGGGGMIHGRTEVTALVDADELLVWSSAAGAERKITRANMRTQVGVAQLTGSTDFTNQLNQGSAFTSSNGASVCSVTITPRVTTSKFLVRFSGCGGADNAGTIVVAMFRGSTFLNSAAASCASANEIFPLVMEAYDSPASVSAQTYSVRCAWMNNGDACLNNSQGHDFGQGYRSTLVVTEVLQ